MNKVYASFVLTTMGTNPLIQLSVTFNFFDNLGAHQGGTANIFPNAYCDGEELRFRIKTGLVDYLNATYSATLTADNVVLLN